MASALPSADQEQLVLRLARTAVAEVAPDELVLFEDTAHEVLADGRLRERDGSGDEAVGFGLDLAMVTPIALLVATSAVQAVGAVVGTVWKEEGTPVVRSWFRKLFRLDRRRKKRVAGSAAAKPESMPLTAEQAQRVRQVALERALALGVSKEKAALLADSITGGLVAGS